MNPVMESEFASAELQKEGTELLVREENALRRVMLRYVHDPNVVDDIFQEVSIKVMRRIASVRNPRTIRGWLFQIARNACLDYLRAQDRRKDVGKEDLSYHDAPGEIGRNPADRFLSGERVQAVHAAMRGLPESQREVLRLRVQEGLDHVAISERLGISRQAVEVRLCRGRAAIKDQLLEIMEGDL